MSTADAKWFRTERTDDAVAHTACTDASTLASIAAYTRGAAGPTTSLDEFRSLQLDKTGGIDLYDCKFASRRLGVGLTVHASYGPGKEYSAAVAEGLRDEPAASWIEAWELLSEGRFGTIQIDYAALPPIYHRSPTFNGPHAVAVLGAERRASVSSLLIGDPLDTRARWLPAAPYWKAGAALSSAGHINLSVTGIREPLRRASVRPGPWYAWSRKAGGGWEGTRRWTRGFSANCTAPVTVTAEGRRRPLCLLTSGVYAGLSVNAEGLGVTVREVV